jgi:hypothetical protein
VVRSRRADQLAAGVRELGVVAAAIVVAAPARDQTLLFEPVGEPGDSGAAEQQAVGELAHPQVIALRVYEVHQHLVGAQRQPVRALELGVQLVHHVAVRGEHPAPRRELAIAQKGGG